MQPSEVEICVCVCCCVPRVMNAIFDVLNYTQKCGKGNFPIPAPVMRHMISILCAEREREGERERAVRVLEHTFNLLIPISMELNVPRAEDSTSTKQELNGQKQLLLKVL